MFLKIGITSYRAVSQGRGEGGKKKGGGIKEEEEWKGVTVKRV